MARERRPVVDVTGWAVLMFDPAAWRTDRPVRVMVTDISRAMSNASGVWVSGMELDGAGEVIGPVEFYLRLRSPAERSI